jgi:hypothetical protein
MNDFDHEKLDVYVAAIDFVALADEIGDRVRRYYLCLSTARSR